MDTQYWDFEHLTTQQNSNHDERDNTTTGQGCGLELFEI